VRKRVRAWGCGGGGVRQRRQTTGSLEKSERESRSRGWGRWGGGRPMWGWRECSCLLCAAEEGARVSAGGCITIYRILMRSEPSNLRWTVKRSWVNWAETACFTPTPLNVFLFSFFILLYSCEITHLCEVTWKTIILPTLKTFF
jgi:hypothetical protein